MCLNPWNNCLVFNAKECVMRYLNTAPRFFNQLLSVWMSDDTLFLVFGFIASYLKYPLCKQIRFLC